MSGGMNWVMWAVRHSHSALGLSFRLLVYLCVSAFCWEGPGLSSDFQKSPEK